MAHSSTTALQPPVGNSLMEPLDQLEKIIEDHFKAKTYLRVPEMQHFRDLVSTLRKNLVDILLPAVLTASTRATVPAPVTPVSLSPANDSPQPIVQQPIQQRRETYARVVIKDTDMNLPSSSTLENSISKLLKDRKIDATIQSCRPTKSGDTMLVNFNASDDVNLIANNISSDLGFRASGSPPILPKLTISHIPQHIDVNTIAEELFSANKWLDDSKEEQFEILFSYIHKDFRSIICKVSPNIRQMILNHGGKVRVGARNCPVKDRIHVKRCTKCNLLGHTRSGCTATTETCAFCSAPHKTYDCPHQSDTAMYKCINCSKANNDNINHAAHHQNCPSFLLLRQKTIMRTNWGKSRPPQF